MNPMHFFQRFAAAELEKNLTNYLVNNRIFQYFAHKSQKTLNEAAEKLAKELADKTSSQSFDPRKLKK
jgi:hypothetical protein